MNQNLNNTAIPVLRFPEFRGTEGWAMKTLGEICSNISSGKDKINTHGKYDLYGSTGIIGKTDSATFDGKFILVARVGANAGQLNRVNRIKHKFGVTDNTLIVYLNPSENIDFIFYLLDNIGLNKMVFGSGQPLITGGQLKALVINLPLPREQQKIANCLTALDDVITAASQKLDALKAHKSGLMQQLFPAEGETVPQLRFPEFREGDEWAEKTLKEICEINPRVSQLPASFVYIDLESVEAGVLIQKKIIQLKEAPSRAQRLLKIEDVIFQTVRPYQKNNYFFQPDDHFPYVASTGYAQLRARQHSGYLFQYLHHQSFVDRVLEKCTGSNYPAINSSELAEISVEIPSEAEQQKIASCLSSLDDLIKAQTDRLEALKVYKQGLMQQLFPNP